MNRENRSSWSQVTRQQARLGLPTPQQQVIYSQDIISGGPIINIGVSVDKRSNAASRRREAERDKEHRSYNQSSAPLQNSAKQMLSSGYPSHSSANNAASHAPPPSIGASPMPVLPSLAITFDDVDPSNKTSPAAPGVAPVSMRARNRVSRRAVEYLAEAQHRADKYRMYAAAAPTPILPVAAQVVLPTAHPAPGGQNVLAYEAGMPNHVVGSIAVLGAAGAGSLGIGNSRFPVDENSGARFPGNVGQGGGIWVGNKQDGVLCIGESYVDAAATKRPLPRADDVGVYAGGASSAVADLEDADITAAVRRDGRDAACGRDRGLGSGRGLAAVQLAEERGSAFKSKWQPNIDTSALAPGALQEMSRMRRSEAQGGGYLGSKVEEHQIVRSAKEDAREEARELVAQIRREAEKEARMSSVRH